MAPARRAAADRHASRGLLSWPGPGWHQPCADPESMPRPVRPPCRTIGAARWDDAAGTGEVPRPVRDKRVSRGMRVDDAELGICQRGDERAFQRRHRPREPREARDVQAGPEAVIASSGNGPPRQGHQAAGRPGCRTAEADVAGRRHAPGEQARVVVAEHLEIHRIDVGRLETAGDNRVTVGRARPGDRHSARIEGGDGQPVTGQRPTIDSTRVPCWTSAVSAWASMPNWSMALATRWMRVWLTAPIG